MEKQAAATTASWVEMQLKGVLLDPTHEVPVLILRSVGGHLLLPIWIGLPEANAIAMALEGIRAPRPMTHDLLKSCIEKLGASWRRSRSGDSSKGPFMPGFDCAPGRGGRSKSIRDRATRSRWRFGPRRRSGSPKPFSEAALSAELAVESSGRRAAQELARAGPARRPRQVQDVTFADRQDNSIRMSCIQRIVGAPTSVP